MRQIAVLFGVAIVVLFIPLALFVIESAAAGTHSVEQFCKQIGVYHTLDDFYDPIWRVLGYDLPRQFK